MFDKAIVIGGGMSGLLTARVLSDHYAQVLILDGDALPTDPTDRKGVPQGPHQHVLVAHGRVLLERLFPGLDASIAREGCGLVDWGNDCLVVSSAGEVPRFESDLITRPCTRAMLETQVRRRVLALPNVETRAEAMVEGLEVDAQRRVCGVRLRGGGVIAGSLVVDASGRHSHAPQWLKALGFEAPAESVVDPHLGYASRFYRKPADAPSSWRSVLISTRPPDNPRAAGLWPVEGNRWLLTLAGTSGCYPPQDEVGFLEFARQLISPVIHDAVKHAEPLSPIRGFRNTENRWRHYEKLSAMPERFVVVGDSVCAFNPIYAQGMTVAAKEVLALDAAIRESKARGENPGDGDFGIRFQRRLPNAIRPGWLVATSEDLRWPKTDGARGGVMGRVLHWYLDRMMELTPRSPTLVHAFFSVTHLLRPPASLFRPSVAAPILLHGLNPFRARPAPLQPWLQASVESSEMK